MDNSVKNSQQVLPTDFELYLFHEGTLYESYTLFGAHAMEYEGKKGVRFAVWAPNAQAVAVAGDFNGWDGSKHQMKRLKDSGIWVLFIPDLAPGELYKYEIAGPSGNTFLKRIHMRSIRKYARKRHLSFMIPACISGMIESG